MHKCGAPQDSQVWFKPLATSDVVLNSLDSALREQMRQHYDDAAAIEMESAGMAYAAHIGRMEALAIRGISDRADGNKCAEADAQHQPYAAAQAAAAAIAVIRQLPPPILSSAAETAAIGPSNSTSRTQRGNAGNPRKRTPLSVAHLLSCFADAPLPRFVLSHAAIASVGIPGLSEDRVAAELRCLPTISVTDSRSSSNPVLCVEADVTGLEKSDEHPQVCLWAGALLHHAVQSSRDDMTRLHLLKPHVLALLWRDSRDPSRAVVAARLIRDAYQAHGRYREAQQVARKIGESSGGNTKDGLALGQLLTGCGDFTEAEAVLRQVLDEAARDAERYGLSLVGRTGPSMADVFRSNAEGPFTKDLSHVQRDVLEFVAKVHRARGDALYGLRQYEESERQLHAAAGLLWRTHGAASPGFMVAQLHRAKALVPQGRWEEAVSLLHDALSCHSRSRLHRESPQDDALIRLAHAEVTAGIVASVEQGDTPRVQGVEIFPAPVVKWLMRTVHHTRPEKLTWNDACALSEDAVRACKRAFGDTHPCTESAQTLLDRSSKKGGY